MCGVPGVRFSETHALAAPRALLTSRAVCWATDALADDDTTVSALARRLGVDWHPLWSAGKREAQRRVDDPARLAGVTALGVDEHVGRPGRFGQGRDVPGMVDLTRDADGRVRARLLDVVPGRSGTAYRAWLDARDPQFRAGVTQAALDPPDPRGSRLGRTLRAWRAQVLAYFDTRGLSNGGTEAMNLVIEKTPPGPRLPQLHQLPPPNAPRRQRTAPLPTREATTLRSVEPR
jgi:hypothetical protein